MATLTEQLLQIGNRLEKDVADQVLQKITLDAWKDLVDISPTDTGFLRSRWYVTKYAVPGVLIKNPYTKKNSVKAPDYPAMGLRIEFGDTIKIYNNTEYASYLEHGTSKMRAQPMVQPVEIRINNELRKILSALNKRKIK